MAHASPRITAAPRITPLRVAGARGPWLWGAALAHEALEERERWVLWLPVLLALGVAAYFGLAVEPPGWIGQLLLGLCLVALVATRRHGTLLTLTLALTLPVAGFVAAQLRTATVAAPVLERTGSYALEGRVVLVEDLERRLRLVVDAPVIDEVAPEATPGRVRFSVRNPDLAVAPGDLIRARVRLMPPSPPAAPGDFDFGRHAFFEGLGAVGYAYGEPEVVARGAGTGGEVLAWVRRQAARTVGETVPGTAGAVAAALLTGLRGGIPDHVWTDMQASGLAHLLAISGLHLGLVAGTLFFVVRIAIALVPPLVLRINGKKVAAALALLGAFGYLLLSGGTVPTQRAFIMTALMLLAVMVDRNPFSMRLVGFAALVVLTLRPEALLGPSFQMSFAAVIALIAVYEGGVGPGRASLDGLDRRLLLYVAGVFLTTIVASVATAPYAVQHFGRLPTYGVLANLVAVPLTAFWIMPAGLFGLIAWPFGLYDPFFQVMGIGIELLLAVAAWVAGLPGASVRVPQPPLAATVALTLGGVWLCLWRRPWRRLGLIGVVVAAGFWLLHRPPDVLIDARGNLIAVRLDAGLALAPFERDSWVQGQWLERFGQDETVPWPEPGAGQAGDPLLCDALGCVYERDGRRIAFARRAEALFEDCALADLVFFWPRIERCPDGGELIGPRALRATGGIALRIAQDGSIVTRTVRAHRGERPWTVQPPARSK